MCRDAPLERPVITQIRVSFFLRTPCTSVYDVTSDQWVDLCHRTKRCLSWPQLAEEEIQKQPGKQAEVIRITKAYTSYPADGHGVSGYLQ